jgi:hypothetical protein
MPVLPVLSGREVFQVSRSSAGPWRDGVAATSSSSNRNHIATASVPDHKEVAKGTLRSLVRAAGLTAEAFAAEAEKL